MTPEMLIAVAGTFVLFAVAVGWGVSSWLAAHSAGAKRVRALVAQPAPAGAAAESTLVGSIDPRLARLSKLLPRKSAADLSALQLRLTRAGYRQPEAAVWFSLAQLATAAAFAVVAVAAAGISHVILAVPAAFLGFIAPSFWIGRQTRARQRAIWAGLPDLLDLLTLCVEAGTGLDQAVAKATAELELAHPALADETRLMTTEIRAGRARQEAFANFATRTGLEDVRTLVTMLAQTDRFGTSIAQALRTHADTTRLIRKQQAQERAAKLSVKLVFPLALCLFPALYMVIFGPIAIKIFRVLMQR